MRFRVVSVLTVGMLATVAAACGTESIPEELFAIPVERSEAAANAAETPELDRADGEMVTADAPEADADADDAGASQDGTSTTAATDASSDATGGADTSTAAHDAGADRPARGSEGGGGDGSNGNGDRDGDRGKAQQPSDKAIASFVSSRARSAVASDHRVVDVTLDGTRDVIVGLLSVGGGVELVLGRWDGEAVNETGRVQHPDGTGLGSIVVRDLDGDGGLEILLPHRDRPHRRVFVATTNAAGVLAVPGACPVPAAASHTMDFGSGAEVVDLACVPNEAKGRDRLIWSDGVFAGAIGAANQRPDRDA